MAYQNFYTTKLYTDVSAADTTITLETPPTVTSGRLVLEARNVSKREVIKYTGVSGNQVTGVLRGQGGTTAQTHLANTLVEMNLTAEDLEDAINVPNDIVTRFHESLGDFIASGLVWSQTALLVGEMTAGVVYIDGERLVIGALSGINFTASKDTYVDVGVDGVVDYDAVANGASAPALAGSHVRIAKVVTNGSGITSVVQTGVDSLGNTISPSGSVTAPKIDFGGAGSGVWWEEIGRTTLASAGDTISVQNLPAFKYLKVYLTAISTGGTIDTSIRLNNDSSNIYSQAAFYNNSGAPAVDAGTSLTGITVDAFTSASGTVTFSTIDISNLSTHSKRMVGATVSEQTSGAGSAPTPYNFTGKYVSNTQVSRIDFLNAGTGDFAIGSEVIVLGHN
jgi:hypothetical protein